MVRATQGVDAVLLLRVLTAIHAPRQRAFPEGEELGFYRISGSQSLRASLMWVNPMKDLGSESFLTKSLLQNASRRSQLLCCW